eukprot:4806871-Pyramimonas_sp.AAC.1
MDVVLNLVGHVVVNHVLDVRKVQTLRRGGKGGERRSEEGHALGWSDVSRAYGLARTHAASAVRQSFFLFLVMLGRFWSFRLTLEATSVATRTSFCPALK